jgi:hypothetical protein
MDTSLAEEVQQAAKTLASDSFFMSPFRSFTTSGCFARISEPAVAAKPGQRVPAETGAGFCRC